MDRTTNAPLTAAAGRCGSSLEAHRMRTPVSAKKLTPKMKALATPTVSEPGASATPAVLAARHASSAAQTGPAR